MYRIELRIDGSHLVVELLEVDEEGRETVESTALLSCYDIAVAAGLVE